MQATFDFSQHTVMVTGASGGIGSAAVNLLAQSGARVIAVDMEGQSMSSPSGAEAQGIEFHTLDVGKPQQWEEIMATICADGSTLHGLVNTAGITRRSRVMHASVDDVEAAYRINAVGALNGIQAVSKRMQPGASIVNVGSVAALTGHYPVAYTMSKWAVRGLSASAATELGPRGIRVNTVHPGFIDTPMTAGADARFRRASLDETPLNRAGKPEEVASVIAFLLSAASAFMTGAELAVDGGQSAHGGAKSISDALR